MMQIVRKFTTGWVAWSIIVLIVFGMLFFGIEHYFQTRIPTYVAKIDAPPSWWRNAPSQGVLGNLAQATVWQTHEIDQREFQQRFDRFRQQARTQAGAAFDPATIENLETKREVLEAMIDERVMELAARADGVAIDASQVRAAILQIEGITQDGEFIGEDAYRLWLQARGLTAETLESLVAQELIAGAMPDAIRDSGMVGDGELDRLLRLQGETRSLHYFEVVAAAETGPAPEESALAEWHQRHADRYRSIESLAVSYIVLDTDAMQVELEEPTEEQLRERYEMERARFGTDEERQAAHLLIRVAADADAATVEAARLRALALAQEARSGTTDFATIAARESEDLGSRELGGDLGVIGRGVFPEAFEQMVYLLAEGEISEPVRTDEGWHVIQLTHLQPADIQPFEAVRGQLAREFQEGERERIFSERAGTMVDAILREPNSLAAVAEELGLELQQSGRFTREAGEGIAALEPVRIAAFAREQRDDRIVSDPIEIAPGRLVVLQVSEHQPAVLRPLAEVRGQVLSDYLEHRRQQALRRQAEALLERARQGEPLPVLAAEIGTVVQQSERVGRMAGLPDPAIVATAFRQRLPAAGEAAPIDLAEIPGGRIALVSTVAVQPGDLAGLTPEIRSQLRQQLAQMRGEVERQAMVRALRGRFEITVAEERL